MLRGRGETAGDGLPLLACTLWDRLGDRSDGFLESLYSPLSVLMRMGDFSFS